MHRAIATVSALLALMLVGAGTASADPINKNTRTVLADCNGEALTLVFVNGASAHVAGDTRVGVLMGATRDGEWIIPIVKGQSKADLVPCRYLQLFDGHQFVIYLNFSGSPAR